MGPNNEKSTRNLEYIGFSREIEGFVGRPAVSQEPLMFVWNVSSISLTGTRGC